MSSEKSRLAQTLAQHSPLVILAGLCLGLAILSPEFRQLNNLQQVALRTCVIAVIATGQVLVIITAGIDLSVGSVAALSGVCAALVMTESGMPWPVGIAVGIGVGAACGAVNGVLITKGRIPPFIVTLGMMMVARGLALLAAGAKSVFGLPDGFLYLGGSRKILGVAGWWLPVGLTVLIAVIFAIVLTQTRYGRAIYAIGGNIESARLSGIPVDRVRIIAYTLCGGLAGFGGLLLAARTSIADPSGAFAYELDAIAACVIGGASLMGGEGGALGVLAGALIMNVLVNVCNLNDISVYWQQVLVGSLIIALVYYDSVRKRRAGLLKD